jgi:hypothetical protein
MCYQFADGDAFAMQGEQEVVAPPKWQVIQPQATDIPVVLRIDQPKNFPSKVGFDSGNAGDEEIGVLLTFVIELSGLLAEKK